MSAADRIAIPRLTWFRLVGELRGRGGGRRESGAFLLGRVGAESGKVEALAYYDDLDPHALDSGMVMFHAGGYAALWALCERKGMRVLADMHTHPGRDVGQSDIDMENPMVPVAGHIALIAPRYGATSRWSLEGVGAYVFLGNGRWHGGMASQHTSPVRLCHW